MLKFVNSEKLTLKRAKTMAFHLYMQCLEREYYLLPITNPTPMKNCLERCFQGCRTIKHCLMHKTPRLWASPLKMLLFYITVKEQTVLEKTPPLTRSPHPSPRSQDRSTHREPAIDWPFTPVITTRPLASTLRQGKSLFVQRTGVSLTKKPLPHGSPMPWNNMQCVPQPPGYFFFF